MYIIIIVAILLFAFFVRSYVLDKRRKKRGEEEKGLQWAEIIVLIVLMVLFFVGLICALVAGKSASYGVYNLEKGSNIVKLSALPGNDKRPESQFIWTEVSLEGDLYYYYLPERIDGSQKIEKVSASNYLIDKRSGEEPHIEIYFVKGFQNWQHYVYMIPNRNKDIYVIVVPESEPVEDTFNLE